MLREEYDRLVGLLVDSARALYGSRLVSIVLFGSTARGTPGPESDIDVLIVADPLPAGRLKRVAEFEAVESGLGAALRSMKDKGLGVSLSPVFKTPDEVKMGSPLFLDMVEDGQILFDRGDFMKVYLQRLRERLQALGARKVEYRGAWYWDLKPGYRRGDVIDL
ncbi:MAG: nucleotidyltransferase domain-containing protein [Bacillota bacterium]